MQETLYGEEVEEKEVLYNHTNIKELIIELYDTESEFKFKKDKIEFERIELWFKLDWEAELGKPKVTQSDKEKHLTSLLKEEYEELAKIEMKFHLLKRQYDVALKYSYEVLNG